MKLNKFTVLCFVPETQKSVTYFVSAKNGREAYTVVANVSDISILAVVDGWLEEGKGIYYPGTHAVTSGEVLRKPKAFGGEQLPRFFRSYDFQPNDTWWNLALKHSDDDAGTEGVQAKAEELYLYTGGRIEYVSEITKYLECSPATRQD